LATSKSPSLSEALSQYLSEAKGKENRGGHQELTRFIQRCGRDRKVDELTPPEIGDYAETAGVWGADSSTRLKSVKAFLAHLKEKGFISISLAPHLRVPKTKRRSNQPSMKTTEQAELSPDGFANLQARLETLKEGRVKVVADIQRAMADKDFKENSPLDAAKERQGMIESSIRDLESILSTAVVSAPLARDQRQVAIGSIVTLKDTSSGKEIRYTLVDSRESDPIAGKISSISPVGKALLHKTLGEQVQITVPRGTTNYVVEKVESRR